MELSPLAKEKLASIGELTREEKEGLRYSEQLTSLLADYFTNKMSPEELWQELKKQRDAGRAFIIREAQIRLVDAMSLSSSDADFDRERRGMLALETLKDGGNYTTLELNLNSMEKLRHQYREEKEQTYNAIKANVERQVRLSSQQLTTQAKRSGGMMNVQSSVEATTKISPEWRSFLSRHEKTYLGSLKEQRAKLREML